MRRVTISSYIDRKPNPDPTVGPVVWVWQTLV